MKPPRGHIILFFQLSDKNMMSLSRDLVNRLSYCSSLFYNGCKRVNGSLDRKWLPSPKDACRASSVLRRDYDLNHIIIIFDAVHLYHRVYKVYYRDWALWKITTKPSKSFLTRVMLTNHLNFHSLRVSCIINKTQYLLI